MLKLMKYLKKSALYIVCIIALLFLQAYCDLELPDYTSKIVNVGIQQKGIEDGVPEALRASSMETLQLLMSDEDWQKVEEAYTEEEEIYTLKKLTSEQRTELNHILGEPMLVAYGIAHASEMDSTMLPGMEIPNGADPEQMLKLLPKEAREKMLEQIHETISAMPESIVTQSAINYVSQEYTEMGMDMDARQLNYLLMAGLRMIGMALMIMLAAIMTTFFSSRVAAAFGHDLRGMIYRKVIGFSSAEYHRFSTASLITRCTNDVQQVQMTTAIMLRMILYAPILGIGGILKVLQTDTSMTWILAVAVAAIMLVILILFKVAMPKFTRLQILIDNLNLVSREFLTGTLVIRAFSREKTEEERFEKANRDLMKTNLFVNRCMTFMMPIMMIIMNGLSVTIIYFGAHAVDNGSMQVGNIMAFIQYAMQIIMSFLMITMMSIMLPRANVAGKRIQEVLETTETILDPEQPAHPEKDAKGTVEFKNVTFAYPEADGATLENISFTAEKGQTVAIIGSTGSGKTTLVNLIPRFYDVTAGSILVDGVDVREMSQKELRDCIGYVPQKGVLFSGTLESNILYGAENAGEEKMKEAARVAQATEFIENKKKTFQSSIAQGGSNVSGGQKQRLSIARAIAKDPEIYIFDDSFSALDYKTDVQLRKALREYTGDATTLIVAQRISTILHADKILVLDDGKLAGIGTHKELLKTCEVYRQIAMSQLSEEELANE